MRVHNRTPQRARALAAALGVAHAEAVAPADVLVNCTTVGLHEADDAPIDLGRPDDYGVVVDLVYREGGTALVRAARAAGHQTVDGLEILVRQGALSLRRWSGREPSLDVMRAAAGISG